MLSKAWGKQSKTIMERHTDALQPYERRQLKAFIRRDSPTANTGDIEVWYQRRKHSAERLWHAVIYRDDGSYVAYPKVIRFYKTLLWIAGVALICYYSVGIIATNTTFAPLFHKFFFWIAILWSLSGSALLSWLVWVIGAGKSVGFFLVCLGTLVGLFASEYTSGGHVCGLFGGLLIFREHRLGRHA